MPDLHDRLNAALAGRYAIEAGGLLFYVMPYVAGGSLRERLRRGEGWVLDAVLHLVRDVATALEHAHRQGIIHRDVTPENVLFFEGEPMVADFGIARAITSAGGDQLTRIRIEEQLGGAAGRAVSAPIVASLVWAALMAIGYLRMGTGSVGWILFPLAVALVGGVVLARRAFLSRVVEGRRTELVDLAERLAARIDSGGRGQGPDCGVERPSWGG